MIPYPEGGGTVGTANQVMPGAPAPEQQQVQGPDLNMLMEAMAKKQGAGKTSTGGIGGKKGGATANPAVTKGGMQSALGGGSAPASSGGMMSKMASAGPWAALAAAIVANESKQRGDGNRGNSTGEHIGDMVTGKVLERDLDRYLPHNTAGNIGRRVGMMGTPSGIVRNTKDLGGWIKGLF